MYGKVWIEINATVFKDLYELHEQWRRENPSMARQEPNYMIKRLIENYKASQIHKT